MQAHEIDGFVCGWHGLNPAWNRERNVVARREWMLAYEYGQEMRSRIDGAAYVASLKRSA